MPRRKILSSRSARAETNMPRIGSHEVPTRTLLLMAVDIAATIFALLAATGVRLPRAIGENFHDTLFLARVGVVTLVCWLSLYFNDLYDFRVVRRRADLLAHTMQALGTACLALAVIYFITPGASLGRGIVLTAAPLMFVLLLSWRLSANATNLLARGDERVLIMGTGEGGVSLVRHILGHPEYNMKVVGFLDEAGQDIGKSLVNPRIVGATADVEEIVAREKIDRVVLSLKERRGSTPVRELLNLKLAGIRIEDVHNCFERLSGRIRLEHLSPSWLILSDGFKKSSVLLAVKRTMDILVSSIILLLVSPLLPVVALAICLESGLPIFFRQTRVGYRGHEFQLLKFRSMVQDAEKNGPQWASLQDSRITRVGRILRKTRLDEIPQLFNVFRGEMSLVGPRPERPVFCEMLSEKISFFNLRHSVRPGLTGWAQVRFRYGANLEDAKGKLELDLFYLKNLSLLVDCAILFETIKVVVLGRGAH
jgi:sugar transferase (PEP-CTERM system associated)